MSSRRPLNQVSDLFFAIGDTIHAAQLGVDVANYDEWDGKVGDAVVLIELERTSPAARQQDGRQSHSVKVTLHAVVAGWRKFSALEAANLATVLERLADANRWGFHGRNCDLPTGLNSGPSMFQRGGEGYNAWAASFDQVLTPGEPRDEPVYPSAALQLLASWRVDDGEATEPAPLEV